MVFPSYFGLFFMLFRPIFVLFSDNSKAIFLQFYPVFAFLHPIFNVFSQYMRAIAFLLWYFHTIFKVFLLYLQIRVFYSIFKTDLTAIKIYFENNILIAF